MASVNKVLDLYRSGKSIPDVSQEVGLSRSTVRYHLAKASVLRSRADGVRLARKKLGSGLRGKTRTFTPEHCAAISAGRTAWGQNNAAGHRTTVAGYVEFTTGPNKGRCAHVIAMEARIGRRLLTGEVVHHIDGNPSNNDPHNLVLMTRAAHARLHRREERLKKGK